VRQLTNPEPGENIYDDHFFKFGTECPEKIAKWSGEEMRIRGDLINTSPETFEKWLSINAHDWLKYISEDYGYGNDKPTKEKLSQTEKFAWLAEHFGLLGQKLKDMTREEYDQLGVTLFGKPAKHHKRKEKA
jgi:hypothetical protein